MTLGLKAYRIMMGHLTRKTPDKKISDLINTGQLKTADEVSQPPKKQDVEHIEAFNEFNKRNPKADGGRMEFQEGTNLTNLEKKQNLYNKVLKELPKESQVVEYDTAPFNNLVTLSI